MVLSEPFTYEKVYYTLWEAGQRYSQFAQFRVIGKSHDDRMIPMLEIGNGLEAVFCIAGANGTDRWISTCLVKMIQEYCLAFESGWLIDDLYHIRELLEDIRLCFIPVINPDGLEICDKGFRVIRNPIYRQMLRMMETEPETFTGNARGINIRSDFPTSYYSRKRVHQEPASENETKALIRIFQEYKSLGLLSFCHRGKRIIYFHQPQALAYNQRSYRLARHLQKNSSYNLEKFSCEERRKKYDENSGGGTPEQYYSEITKQPALMIESPDFGGNPQNKKDAILNQSYQEIHTLPLEYISSLNH